MDALEEMDDFTTFKCPYIMSEEELQEQAKELERERVIQRRKSSKPIEEPSKDEEPKEERTLFSALGHYGLENYVAEKKFKDMMDRKREEQLAKEAENDPDFQMNSNLKLAKGSKMGAVQVGGSLLNPNRLGSLKSFESPMVSPLIDTRTLQPNLRKGSHLDPKIMNNTSKYQKMAGDRKVTMVMCKN